jgi:hypothetical protein
LHYFSCSGGTGTDFYKKCVGTHYAELVILRPMGSVGLIVHSGVPEEQHVDALFFVLGWARYGFHKKRAWTRYAKLVFLHMVGSASHVVYSGSSGAPNIDELFFVLM